MTNHYFYLAIGAPAVMMLVGSIVRNERTFLFAIAISIVSTYALCNLAVDEKWRERNRLAVTEFEKERATHDGANRVFTAILIAPLEAVILTAFWGWCSRLLVRAISIQMKKANRDHAETVSSG